MDIINVVEQSTNAFSPGNDPSKEKLSVTGTISDFNRETVALDEGASEKQGLLSRITNILDRYLEDHPEETCHVNGLKEEILEIFNPHMPLLPVPKPNKEMEFTNKAPSDKQTSMEELQEVSPKNPVIEKMGTGNTGENMETDSSEPQQVEELPNPIHNKHYLIFKKSLEEDSQPINVDSMEFNFKDRETGITLLQKCQRKERYNNKNSMITNYENGKCIYLLNKLFKSEKKTARENKKKGIKHTECQAENLEDYINEKLQLGHTQIYKYMNIFELLDEFPRGLHATTSQNFLYKNLAVIRAGMTKELHFWTYGKRTNVTKRSKNKNQNYIPRKYVRTRASLAKGKCIFTKSPLSLSEK